jgi:hypothetical protein
MKKYKTSEVIAMLEENPKLKFKNGATALYVNASGYLEGENNGKCSLDGNIKIFIHKHDIGIFKTDEWELIQQPIPFLEAVKAYAAGKKTIRCESSIGIKRYEYQGISNSPILDELGNAVSHLEILQGTWFVEVEQ